MKKLIEITELKVGDVLIEKQYGSIDRYIIQGSIGNIYFLSSGTDDRSGTLEYISGHYKKQVEQERWRAENGELYWYLNSQGQTVQASDYRRHWDNARYELGNYFALGEGQGNQEAFKEFFNKIKDEEN